MKKLLIIDTYAFLYRAYFAPISTPLTNSKGENISAIINFFKTIFYLIKTTSCTHIFFASDSGVSWRSEFYTEYKANRDHMPDDLKTQRDFVFKVLREANINLIDSTKYEADDIIALCANNFAKEVDTVIATPDKDLLQIVDDEKNIKIYRPGSFNNKWEMYNEQKIFEKYNVKKDSFSSYLSLLGDSADNIKGVKGIGEKSAAELLSVYNDIFDIYNNLDKIEKPRIKNALTLGKEDAFQSFKLIDLKEIINKNEIFFSTNLQVYNISNIDFTYLYNVFLKEGYNSLSETLNKLLKDLDISLDKTTLEKENEIFYYNKPQIIYKSEEDIVSLIKSSSTLSVHYYNYFYISVKKGESIKISITDKIKFALIEFLKTKGKTLISYDAKTLFKIFTDKNPIEVNSTLMDINLMAYLLNSERAFTPINELLKNYLSLYIKKEVDSLFESEDDESFISDKCLLLLDYLIDDLKNKSLYDYYINIEQKVIPFLDYMEKSGIYISEESILELSAQLEKEIGIIEEKIYTLAGHKFNISSPKQISEVLFDELKINPVKKTKTGFSVNQEVLESLVSSHPIVEEILHYRALFKLYSTYTTSLLNYIDDKDKRLHTTFLQSGTATGRFSSVKPNLQNIPIRDERGRLIRKAFFSEKNNILVSFDYSQIELVVLAHFSKDKKLITMFNNGKDVHNSTASLLFSKDADKITREERRIAKTINFGIIYGMSAHSLSNDLKISYKDAQAFLNNYFEIFKGVKDFINKTIEEVRETGFTTTLLGHRRYFKEINNSNRNIRSATERAAVNSVIQGSAADILKTSLINIYKDYIEKKDYTKNTCPILTIHDELIFEVKKDCADSFIENIIKIMTQGIKLRVNIKVGVEKSTCWGDMH